MSKNYTFIELLLHKFSVHSNFTGFSPKFFKINRNMWIFNLHFESFFNHETNTLVKNAVPTIFKLIKKVNYFIKKNNVSFNDSNIFILFIIFRKKIYQLILRW